MKTSWPEVPFEELYAEPSRNGLTRPRRVRGSGYKMINMGELFEHDRICDPAMERVPMNEREKRDYRVERGDLLFARQSLVAAGAGKCSIVLEVPELTTFESHLIRVRLNDKTSPLFYYYYFSSPPGKAKMQSIVRQVAAAGIRGSELAKLPVPFPGLRTQHKIAAILSAYDDLIENNTGRIAILEEMGQMLYREWFIHFRFPGHEEVAMVDSELGAVPKGWRVVQLSEVAEINRASLNRRNAPERINYVTIGSVSEGRVEGVENIAYEEAPSRARRVVQDGDIIWTSVRPNLKSYALILDPVPNMIVSTGFAVITPRRAPYTYLYQALTMEWFVDYLTKLATGAAYPAVRVQDFEDASVLLPTQSVLTAFHHIAAEFYAQKQSLGRRNEVLRQARDLLLPRLVSGKLDVSDLEMAQPAARG
jgi:type I restriction enzyme S subunit